MMSSRQSLAVSTHVAFMSFDIKRMMQWQHGDVAKVVNANRGITSVLYNAFNPAYKQILI